MIHYVELIHPYQDGTTGLKAAAKIPFTGNIVGVEVYRESAQDPTEGTVDQVLDIRKGSVLSSLATIFANPAHKPTFIDTALSAVANAAAFPVACTKGQTVGFYRETAFTFHGGNRPTAVIAIEDGLLNEKEVQAVTESLADNATSNITAALGKAFVLNRIEVSHASRVTVYRTPADRTADASRPIGELPGAGDGVLVDANLEAGSLDLPLTPIIYGSTGETPRVSDIPIRVQNRSGGTTPVTVTFTVNTMEL
jgi:hypothetical protein